MLEKGDEIYGILDTSEIFEYKMDVGDFSEEFAWCKCFKIKSSRYPNLLLNVEDYWMITRAVHSKFIVADIIDLYGFKYYICIPLMLNPIKVIEL